MKRFAAPFLIALFAHTLAFALIPLFGGGGEGEGPHLPVRVVALRVVSRTSPVSPEREGKKASLPTRNFVSPDASRETSPPAGERGRKSPLPQREGGKQVSPGKGEIPSPDFRTGGEPSLGPEGENSSAGNVREAALAPREEARGEETSPLEGKEGVEEGLTGPLGGEGIFSPPRLLSMPKPAYPFIARKRGLEGVVLLSVLVDREGRPKEVRVLRSSGNSLFDERARNSAMKALFEPAYLGGMPVEAEKKIAVRFTLE
ncbi:MAG: energy transducer TonB [Deltaproteobacteria bacterium]|nr:MAG: energy transducer TonB [Deltaproteobacteria bacterium]